ncbi:MAG: 2-oxoglutarate dehydrogenase E1 component [Acidobacteriota bacterium]
MSRIEALVRTNVALVDELQQRYLVDPDTLTPDWRAFFAGLELAEELGDDTAGSRTTSAPSETTTGSPELLALIQAFRSCGHLAADLDPLGRSITEHALLEPSRYGITPERLDEQVELDAFAGFDSGSVGELVAALQQTYCGPIGVEYNGIAEPEPRRFLEQRFERCRGLIPLTSGENERLLSELVRTDVFEEYLQRTYPGAKRFSLEGGCSLVPFLRETIRCCLADQVETVVFGMTHRGRLNVLAQVLGKPLEYILGEFEGSPLPKEVAGYGDVKYHQGYSSDWIDGDDEKIHLTLAFNPSHLEAIGPVVEGIVRAKQDHLGDSARQKVVPVLVHGDAAFMGQGVVAETFNLSGLPGFTTGGTIHVIVNNQVGFTTDPCLSRSTRHASDVARVVRAPVLHVNGDHPAAVVTCARIATEFRQRFNRDVIIDINCYRRRGHNETDDATFTQPVQGRLITDHETESRLFAQRLEADGQDGEWLRSQLESAYVDELERAREAGTQLPNQHVDQLRGLWSGLSRAGSDWSAETAVERDVLETVARRFVEVPEGFAWHRTLKRLMEKRAAMVLDDGGLDWGAAESLALGSLLHDGTGVRLTGQDVGRGTFGQRHVTYVDQQTGERHRPLEGLATGDATLQVHESPLSEEACLGFEYGFSIADPWTLTLWEAQFGDFANGAQIVIDQLLAPGEFKWARMCGLVLLLPHGYEGQGPEHSSARPERFLELCAEENLQVASPTTPAQYFHLLRAQAKRSFRRPLVVLSPKSLLRHARARSTVTELVEGHFEPVLTEPDLRTDEVERVLLCSGRVSVPLAEALDALPEDRRARLGLVRLERLYPFPHEELASVLASLPRLTELCWVQEEPENMGAWRQLRHRFEGVLPEGVTLTLASRPEAAVTATGSFEQHRQEEDALLDRAVNGIGSTSEESRSTRKVAAL